MSLPQNIIAEVITFCNRDLVPDENFDAQVNGSDSIFAFWEMKILKNILEMHFIRLDLYIN